MFYRVGPGGDHDDLDRVAPSYRFAPSSYPACPGPMNVRLPAATLGRLRDAAAVEGLGPSEFVRRLVERWSLEAGLGPIEGEDDA